MNRDIGLIFFAKIVRTFCYGALGLFIPLYLTQLGFDEKKLGLALTLILLANAFWTFFVRYPAEKYGPRLALVFLSLLIPCSSV
ncbi:MAG: hypothetical protein HY399_01440, partial [Elusimicrobia bacterium]|nr:hypothetical protein [Elusimicrobiota bacterium]